MSARYAQVLVEVEPDHLDRAFDYRVPDDASDEVQVGSRVEVVFAGRRVLGLVVGLSGTTTADAAKVRDIRRVLGAHRWATPDEIEVLRWAGGRFAAPVGLVLRHALPRRVVDVERQAAKAGWYPETVQGRCSDVAAAGEVAPDRPPVTTGPDVDEAAWSVYGPAGAALREGAASARGAWYWRPLPGERLGDRIAELAALTLAGGRDVLVVVPEPHGEAADRLVAAFGERVVDVRGEPGQRATYRAWLAGRCGHARVVVGERRVAFWPLRRLGLAVVVDEANPALKERRAPRHHVREVLLERARRAGAVALLVGTVPSAEAWRLLAQHRLRPIVPERSVERAAAPLVTVDDRRDPRSRGRLGTPALQAVRGAVERGQLGVVLAARRGEGRALVCSECGRRLACPDCDSSLALDPTASAFCEGCGWRTAEPRCECGSQHFAPLAAGAQRLGADLARSLPGVNVAVLEGYAQEAPPPPAVVVTTRGSALTDAPGPVGAVVLPDLDGLLRRPSLDAAEDALRLALRLASWTASSTSERPDPPHPGPGGARPGRGGNVSEAMVVVQTREPAHHAIQALVRWDPGGFWRAEAARRAELRFPPAAYAIRIEVGGDAREATGQLRDALPSDDEILGPRPQGERSGLLVKSSDRTRTLAALTPLRHRWSQEGRDFRVDVDPVDA